MIPAFALLLTVGQVCADEKPIQVLEESRQLSDYVKRDLWRFSIDAGRDKLVLATFTVTPDKNLSSEGLPKGYSIQTIHYCPSGRATELIAKTSHSRKSPREAVSRISTQITGFGQQLTIPNLRVEAGRQSFGDPWGPLSKTFIFSDSDDPTIKPTKRLTVTLSLKAISRDKDVRHMMYVQRWLERPKMGEHPWSLTLPPIPEDLEQSVAEEP
jgi:hypothetical protein